MTLKEFEKIIKNAVASLPEEFRKILEKNQIKLLARSTVPESISEKHPGAVVFGVFVGVPYGRFVNVQTEPTRIELYKSSFERVFKSNLEIRGQILKTVMHEIGHYFGFSEEGIRKILK